MCQPAMLVIGVLLALGTVDASFAASAAQAISPTPRAAAKERGMAASNSVPADAANLAILRRLLNEPEGQVDLARAKVTIDHMVDPKVDVEGTLGLLDQWAAKIRARFPPGASNKAKINLLVSTLYESGPWNDHRPFGYDFSDPYGRDPNNTLLSTYLARRKGQCVIMPIAIVLLGQKLGLPVTMTTAPYHLIVKYGDEEIGQWTNLEATSGRFYADSGYEQALRIPSEAIKNDTFMRPYTQKESVAIRHSVAGSALQGAASAGKLATADQPPSESQPERRNRDNAPCRCLLLAGGATSAEQISLSRSDAAGGVGRIEVSLRSES